FSAGAAIDEMADDNANSLRARRFITSNWEDLARFSKPTIAMVHGFALGGGLELAMMADIIITTPDAKLALPEITLGVMPGAGGSQRLPRLLPPMLAQYLILSGARLSGADAHHHGLAACLYDSAQIMAETTLLAEKIASASLPALKSIKQSFHDARNLPLAEGIGRERERFYNLFDTAEQKAAMKKFLSR
ncbi:MAG: enoyl-CoA hydratase-related protein, partial [Alphaproteobacteria bacterium]|nr:enoyl-CoA hydratase-related protein [Alphaproteobacteria bacterium]